MAFACSLALASDPSPLQDFCVAVKDIKDGVFVNGKFCKDPKLAVADDFFFSGLNKAGNTSNPYGLSVTPNPDYRLFSKILNPGDVFVFPMGLIHFQFNIGKSEAVAFGGLSSQNAGVIAIASAVFGSKPATNPDVLAKAFQLDKDVVKYHQSRF
ncbi:Germin-like protein subfamily 1 member 14 [Hibiscus syriacus]|uniref:Germin-like protein n=1 Tax=Hibiscus syriacus TaxID=106335 RepID=A0A6A2Y9M1_HIBSY|nr:Germin-like protein subfamily 1 member 14 [Hibiscus syriacus]